MKRLLAALLVLLIADFGIAQAIPGPEPGQPDFDISVHETHEAPAPQDQYFETRFLTSAGWDFGDRAGYRCAWVEFFQAGSKLFEVHYELAGGYAVPLQINDRFGDEGSEQQNASLCGDGVGGELGDAPFDGSDHFPHGTTLTFFKDGVQVGAIDYQLVEPGGCDRGYWAPGNEPGESWLWWDEDGPLEHAPGHPLDCGGGPGEPVPVVRAYVKNAAPGVGYCTEDSLDGDLCFGVAGPEPGPEPEPEPTPREHQSTLTLTLTGNIRASGFVRVPDGTAGCSEDRIVVIERRVPGDWVRAGKERTNATGFYSLHVGKKQGVYRGRVMKATLANGDTCMADTSRKKTFLG